MPSPNPSHHAQLTTLLEPVVADGGLVLEEVGVATVGRRRLVRVVVDLPDTEVGAVDLDRVAEVSRAVGARLDEVDVLGPGPYSLEVTTPGVDRPLTEPRHWRRARTRLVTVERAGDDPVTGRLEEVSDDGPVLGVDGERLPLAWPDVRRGLVQVEFTKPPKGRRDEQDEEV
ncbi:ribosome maturation factor RimP [Aquipuribacter sp. SD81]|uniref:ribosome maturation factor RimP n=1 Tax=Aquipuribacter sp. SD81 TaxID=3127703 RepID=UPI00301B0927